MKKFLVVGAFERDNFGDLLFLRILRDFMKDKPVEITPASIIFSDMRAVNGEVIYPYDLMLGLYEWDAVWVVGGEVGGVDMIGAILMDSMDESGQHYDKLGSRDKDLYNKLLHIPNGENRSAYLPDLRLYPKNHNTPIVINSVGLSNSAIGTEMSKNEIAILSQATLSVREERSANFCAENNIVHNLAPDVVSAISYFHPFFLEKKRPLYIVLQVNRELLSQATQKKFASDLKEISDYLHAGVVLLSAGVTFGHDDSSLYEKLIEEYNTLGSKHKMSYFEKRDPLLITELIAGAQLCIATSLHCRIVSESYNVPHVSLFNNKVSNYASTWTEDTHPYGVGVDALKDVVFSMWSTDRKKDTGGSILSEKALENLEGLYSQLSVDKQKLSSSEKTGVFIGYVANQKKELDVLFTSILSEKRKYTNHIQKLDASNKILKDERRALDGVLEEQRAATNRIVKSKSYRVGRIMTAPYRGLRKIASIINRKLER